MSTLQRESAHLNPSSDLCPRCNGTCRDPYTRDDSTSCPECDGLGRVKQVKVEDESPPRPEPVVSYLATQAGEILDQGLKLKTFVEAQQKAWDLADGGHVAIWATEEGGRGPRLVAVLTPGPRGGVQVRWI